MKVLTVALIGGGIVAAALLFRRSGAPGGRPLVVGPDANSPPSAYDQNTSAKAFGQNLISPTSHVARKEALAPYLVSRVTGIPASSVKQYTDIASKLSPSTYAEKTIGNWLGI